MHKVTDGELLAAIGGLSAPGKMPCHSYSIPARYCMLGSKLAKVEGTTCFDCYALKGLYVMPNVKAAMERRFAILQAALADPLKGVAWVEAFAELLRRKERRTRSRLAKGLKVGQDGRYFRWHDSGDLQSVRHLELIVAIADAVPEVSFWLPTREAGKVKAYIEAFGPLPPNLTVRLSVPRMDDGPSDGLRSLGLPLSGVHAKRTPAEGFVECGAYRNDGYCGDCRVCWTPTIEGVSYPKH